MCQVISVKMCFALDLFKGYPDGTFRPAREITRAELSKVVCLALNGGEEPTLDQAAPTFADIEGHWAAPYIRWCAAQGLVSGMSADSFAPDEGITAVQAARILLTALGCDAMQGYYFSRPLPPEELEKILRAAGAQSPQPAPAAMMPD